MTNLTYHGLQDGADFYLYDSPSQDNLLRTLTAPMRVTTNQEAARARVWVYNLLKHEESSVLWIDVTRFANVEA